MIGIFAAAWASVPLGCGPDAPKLATLRSQVESTPAGASVTVEGLIRDIDPSVKRALPATDAAVLSQIGGPTDGFYEFDTVNLRNEPGRIRVEFEKTDGSLAALRQPRPLRILVVPARSPQPHRDRALAERIARELLTFATRR